MKLLIAALTATLLAGCAIGPTGLPQTSFSNPFGREPAGPPMAYGEQTVPLGEAARFIGVSLTPIMVAEDSRCPVGVQCIQAGTARVSTAVVEGGVSRIQVLTLGAPVTVGAHTVALTALCPAPRVANPVIPRDVRFSYAVLQPGQPGPAARAC